MRFGYSPHAIRSRREELNMSKRYLARAAHVDYKTVIDLEAGVRLSSHESVLERVAAVLEVPVTEIAPRYIPAAPVTDRPAV